MVFGSESNIIIFFMIALILLFIYYEPIKSTGICKRLLSDKNYVLSDDDPSKRYIFQNTLDSPHKKRSSRMKNHASNQLTFYSDMNVEDAINVLSKSKKCSQNNNNDNTKKKLIDVNTEFIEMQYHKDYNDTITAINNLTPQKELFNLGVLPVKEVTPSKGNIKDIVFLFMNKLNNEIKCNVQEYLHVNSGWNDMGKRICKKSGFEEQMEELGLPGSLYNEPASKSFAKLIRIDKSEQFNTENQIRFVTYIIIQKPNVRDQMVLKVQFFLEREDSKAGRDDSACFFSKNLSADYDNDAKIDPNQIVIIEQVFTLGYLTDQAKKKTKMDKFHDYNNIQRSDGTFDQEKVIKTMLKKHKERSDELNSFVCTLDQETQEQIHDVSANENTKNIMNALSCFPKK